MLKIHQIKCTLDQTLNTERIARKLGCQPKDILSYSILRESLDARKGSCVFSYTVKAEVHNESHWLKNRDVTLDDTVPYQLPEVSALPEQRPVIVGFGPSGMFAGLILAECGFHPIIIERGSPVEERQKEIQDFFSTGILNPESNVQYGEGGAGTFSDGKLTTRIKDIRIEKVLAEFIEAGAPEAIAWQAHPHLGTDQLTKIVSSIRRKIESLGGEVHFHTRLESLVAKDHAVTGIHTSQSDYQTQSVLLCTGHSAFSTYSALQKQDVVMEAKEFAVGFRAEHPQILIDRSQYGKDCGNPRLSPAEYHMAHTSASGRGVYTFCMCPGGIVIPSSSEPETIVVNGMSYSTRSGRNANSALLVQVKKKDFDHGSVLDGFLYQHALERKAYQMTGSYQAPAENISDYLNHTSPSGLVTESTYLFHTQEKDMHALLSDEMNASLEEGIHSFDRQIPGFIAQGILVGLESRSSSPVRLIRSEQGESIQMKGLYPCGEGAGYAGGIVSSAVDGIRQAENLIHSLQK